MTIFLCLSLKVSAADLTIINDHKEDIDEARIKKQFTTALQFYEKEIRPSSAPVVLTVKVDGCLRTGYDMVKKQIIFCKNNKLISYGLNSIDVFNHELFHALLCYEKAELCSGELRLHIHEALADYFAYLLNPDPFFGENFYIDLPFVRNYQTTWREGLVEADHLKGSILVSRLIKTKSSLKRALTLFEKEDAPGEVQEKVTGATYSKLNRYRLRKNEEIQFFFKFSQEAGVAKVAWKVPEGISVKILSDTSASVKITDDIKSTSADAIFYSNEGVELGFRHYYFGLQKDSN